MADFNSVRGAVVPIPDGPAAGTLDQYGALSVNDQYNRWLFEGRIFGAAVGDGSTELAFAKAAYDEDQPQLVVRVPVGVTIKPLSVDFAVEEQADVPAHIVIGFCQNDIGSGSSTGVTIRPMRTDAPRGSSCVVRDLYTGNSSALTNKLELHRWVMPFDPATDAAAPLRNFEWGARTHSVPLLVGPASFIIWAFTETTSDLEGYASVTWAEFGSTDLT